MAERDWLAKQFEENRDHLQAAAHRMLGSPSEAEDAVQEAWLRLSRSDTREVDNLGGWLTTVVARVCLDALRSRKARESTARSADPGQRSAVELGREGDAEKRLLLADSIGPALLVVLDALEPAERVAFVLHDMFDVPFEEIGPIVGRSPVAARQLASRARRRVRGEAPVRDPELGRHRELVGAFLAASRDGNFEALLALLDPNVILHADDLAVETAAANRWGGAREVRGARAVADNFRGRAYGARPAVIDGAAGAVWTHGGRTRAAWEFVIDGGKIVEIDLRMDPARLAQFEVLGE